MTLQSVLFSAAAAMMLFSSCGDKGNSSQHILSALPEGKKFLDPTNMDTSVSPADNFYMYANGAWLKSTPIPASETRWGSFNLLEDFNKKALKDLLEEASSKTNAAKGSPEQMVGDFYAAGMDTNAIEKAGITPLKAELDLIQTVKDPASLMDVLAHETTVGLNPVFSLSFGPDDKEVTKNVCNLFQGGLGLPDRDYYLKEEAREQQIRQKYVGHIIHMLTLAGSSNADAMKDADAIMKLETEMAKASMDRVSMRDPYKVYNKFTVDAFSGKTPGIDWKHFLDKTGVKGQDTLLVGTPDFFTALAGLMKNTPAATWQVYLKWQLISGMADALSNSFDQEHFDFYGKTLHGQQEQKPRWKRVLSNTDQAVGHQLGKMYTDRYFPEESKKRMLELVNNLQAVYDERIAKLDWMSDSTKKKAQEKLHAFIKKIGYPDKWRDYTGLDIDRSSYAKNILASQAFEYRYRLSKLNQPVDRSEWGMTPPTVNAYYNPAFNEIVFPAGILQYPFFDKNADDAVIYGAIGGVIGHEMTHGFDDQGCEYAADGNLKNWWSKEDKSRFDVKTKQIKDQFDAYTLLGDKHVNGALTLGENIADLGGVTIAYQAFKKTKQGQSQEKIDGFTPDQRFFLSWAQVWRANIRDEEAATRLVVDPHSPSMFRCNGPLSNFEPFYQAFGVKEGNKMYRSDSERAKVW